VVTMKNGVFWDVTTCGSCKNHGPLRKNDSYEDQISAGKSVILTEAFPAVSTALS
jgi:hypothetical protein